MFMMQHHVGGHHDHVLGAPPVHTPGTCCVSFLCIAPLLHSWRLTAPQKDAHVFSIFPPTIGFLPWENSR